MTPAFDVIVELEQEEILFKAVCIIFVPDDIEEFPKSKDVIFERLGVLPEFNAHPASV